MRVCPLVALLAGCPSPEGHAPSDGGPDDTAGGTVDTEDSSGPTDTTPTTEGPSRLEVTCAPTDNLLRFLCTVEVEPAQAVQLVFARADGLSAVRTVSSDEAAASHELPLYFLAPEQVYDVTASAVAWPEITAVTSVTTSALPSSVSSGLTMDGTSTMGMIGSYFPCSSDAMAVVYDTTTGDLLWYQVLQDGGTFGLNDMVQFTEDHTVLGESRGDVIEVDLMGDDVVRLIGLDTAFGVESTGLFGNFHHDIMKANGVYHVMYEESFGGGDVLDNLILFDATGTELAEWRSFDHLDLPANWGGDYLHMNAVYADSAGDIYVSLEGINTVAKLEGDWTSPDFGTVLWTLAGDGSSSGTIDTDWSAVGNPASFLGEHSLIVRPDDRLQLLDNSHGRGLVISVDEGAGTATVDAQYATHEGSCGPQGTSRSTLGGNAVVGCTGSWVREYDGVTSDLLWEAEVHCPAGAGGPETGRWYPLDGW